MFKNYSYDSKDPSNNQTFEIHNVDLAFINGIRRTILTDISIAGVIGETTTNGEEPTMNIIENTGALHNEIIMHRIGLIPVCLTEEEIEGYEDGSIKLELNIKNEGSKIENITTKHIKATRNNIHITDKELATIFPSNKISKEHILITRLRTNEHLSFKTDVVKRCARDNASFNPVSLCNFSYIQDPKEADTKINIIDKERAYYKNKYGDPISFKFDIENININIAAKYLINKSIEIIANKLNKLRENLIKGDVIKVVNFQDIENTFEFFIENEDDTVGNIIQSFVHTRYVRENKLFNDVIKCLYVGYICPHPLKELMIVRITLENETNKSVFVSFLDENCKMIVEELQKIKTEWNTFVSKNNII